MKISFLLIVVALLTACATSAEPASITGSYVHREGAAWFEEFALYADGSFSSWLHARPDLSGSWSRAGDTITLHGDDDSTQSFTIRTLTADELVLQFEGMDDEAIYERL